MKTHNLIQGSPEWHAYRTSVWNASDAPAMMGCSPHKSREQLLQELSTGITEEVSPELQRVFDDGHRFEALARPLAEQIIGSELYPVTGSSDQVIAGRALSASFDGLTMLEDEGFEHKTLNSVLRAAFDEISANTVIDAGYMLPLVYRVQMEQQLIVSGARRILFMASEWHGDTLVEVAHCWYESDEKLRQQIIAGWGQLAEDLANWTPRPIEVKAVGKAPDTLPALHIKVTGSVAASNLAEYRAFAAEVFKGIKRDPSTDEEFADAERTVKWCADVEDRLRAAKEHALSQTADIDALFKAIDDISAEARRVRLDLDKVVKTRKDQLRLGIVGEAQAELRDHVDRLQCRWLNVPAADFAGAIKGKKTLSSIREACSVVLAEAKISANQAAECFKVNREAMTVDGRDWFALFPDFASVGTKPAEDFDALLQLRIARHEEAERQAQARREAAQAAAAKPAAVDQPAEVPPPAARQSTNTEAATLKLGDICARLGFTVTAAFLADTLGIGHAATDKSARLYRDSDWPRICAALVAHIGAVQTARIEVAA